MSWLTNKTVTAEAEQKVQTLREKIEERRGSASSSLELFSPAKICDSSNPQQDLLEKIIGSGLAAGQAIQREWFCDSVCVEFDADEHETWYVCRAPIAATFVTDQVVHWTHWVGRVSTLTRDHLEQHGTFPEQLRYGRPGKETLRPVGPWVRYQFANGHLKNYQVQGADAPAQPDTTGEDFTEEQTTEGGESAPAFGLKDIVELRDLDQDDQIRGPMAGTYILTGGPGVGKTTVALHRIPYLLLQQKEQLAVEVPGTPPDFFTQETMHVVVWKEHLVPYLQQCLQNLRFDRVPVYHIEDWVARTLRDYVPIGKEKGQYQIKGESEEIRRVKQGGTDSPAGRWTGLTEVLLNTFLTGRFKDGHFYNPRAEESAADLQEVVSHIKDTFVGHPLSPQLDLTSIAVGTIKGIETAVEAIRSSLDRLAEEVTDIIKQSKPSRRPAKGRPRNAGKSSDARSYEKMRPVISKAREAVSTLRSRLVGRLPSDYPALLSEFYGSQVVFDAVAAQFDPALAERFSSEVCERLKGRRLSQFDRYLLLWMIHILTQGASSELEKHRPLRQYSHTVIDEAQYYHPLVLRLLVELSQPPVRSVTIVGDLEQKVSSDGGLVAWEDAGIQIESSKIFRLNTSYRWSKAVYRFLDIYRSLTGLRELKEPRRWASGDGVTPEVVACADPAQEVEWLVARITKVRRKNWSIAIVTPPNISKEWSESVIEELKSCDIRSRWAIGEDVRECEEKIIITDYDSIVGLEFDAVFLPSCHRILTPPKPDKGAIQAAWVALTRARRFVAVSHTDKTAIFDDEAFREYRLIHL